MCHLIHSDTLLARDDFERTWIHVATLIMPKIAFNGFAN